MTTRKKRKEAGGNLCAEFRGCSSELLDICEAYNKNKNCWEAEMKPCCRRSDFERCESCEIYLSLKSLLKKQVKTTRCSDCEKLISYSTSKPKRCYQCRKKLANKRQLKYYYRKKKGQEGE